MQGDLLGSDDVLPEEIEPERLQTKDQINFRGVHITDSFLTPGLFHVEVMVQKDNEKVR